MTLIEKVEGEIATKREVKKVLSKHFELSNDSYARNQWLSGLRSSQSGVTICRSPNDKNEDLQSPIVGPNMRSVVKKPSKVLIRQSKEQNASTKQSL